MNHFRWYRPRRIRPGCLDTAHRNPFLTCPYCDHNDPDELTAVAWRTYTQLLAEETEDEWGWTW